MFANLGNVAYFHGEYVRARPFLIQSLDLYRTTDSQANALVALHGLGILTFRTGDYAKARELLAKGLAECRACGIRDMEATFQVSLGLVQDVDGDQRGAKERFAHALAISRELGDVTQGTVCLTNMGNVTRKLGDTVLSAQYYREGLLLVRERPGNRDERVVSNLLDGTAILAMEAGRYWLAAWLLAAGNALCESISAPRPPQDKKEFERAVAKVRAALDATTFDTEWAAGGSAQVDTAISIALETIESIMKSGGRGQS
jgi:tetratricopeptide (TPR) repeat protein